MKLTIIIPAYNEGDGLQEIYTSLVQQFKGLHYQVDVLFIDDGSTDNTAEKIESLESVEGVSIKYVICSRNYGHQTALRIGYRYASGDAIVCMDADLQHPPKVIIEMLDKYEAGYDIVSAVRDDSGNNKKFKKYTSRLFYKVWSLLTDVNLKPGSSDFRLLSRAVADELNKYNESFIFLRGLIPQLGFSSVEIQYAPGPRFEGESKYTIRKMLSLSRMGILWGTVKPLRIAMLLAMVAAAISVVTGCYAVYGYFFIDGTVKAWASIIAVISFLGCLQLLAIAILGEYLGQVLIEARSRPAYHIKKKSI